MTASLGFPPSTDRLSLPARVYAVAHGLVIPDGLHRIFVGARRAERRDSARRLNSWLRATRATARAYGEIPWLFRLRWRKLVALHLRLLDLAAAEHVVDMAVRDGMRHAAEIAAYLKELSAEVQPWRHILDQASQGPLSASEVSGRPAFVLWIPCSALLPQTQSVSHKQVRTLCREVIETCDHLGVTCLGQARFKQHGIPRRLGLPYVSFHSFDPRPGGLHFKKTELSNYYSIDGHGYSGWSALSDTPLNQLALETIDLATARAFVESERARVIGGNLSGCSQPARSTGSPVAGPYVFVALQTLPDAVQKLANIPMLKMLAEVASVCRKRGITVVVKRHPRCREKKVERFLANGGKRGDFVVSTASIHDLIGHAAAVCVVNSGVGAEALLHGKPVYVFGRAEYQQVCFRMTRAGDFAKQFVLGKEVVDADTLARFLYYFRNIFAVNVHDQTLLKDALKRKISGLFKEPLNNAASAAPD